MNCLECRDLIQQFLDGDLNAAGQQALDTHVTCCPRCRELHVAARRMISGLRLQHMPVPSANLAGRISNSLEFEWRRGHVRRIVFRAAIAASILAILGTTYVWTRGMQSVQGPGPLAQPGNVNSPGRSPSLNQSVEEAGQAVIAMSRRAADETVGQGRILLPSINLDNSGPDLPALEPLLDQPSRSLREIQNGMTAALEPVASSARRALDLFLRELPGGERTNKSGS